MILHTQRTTIIPLSASDIPEILEMYHEPDSNTFIAPLLNKTDDYYREFLSTKITNNEREIGFWVVRDTRTKVFMGTVNLNQFADTDMVHIGCHLKKALWGKGYAFELMTCLRDYGINQRKLDAIHGVLNAKHSVSKKLLEKLSFQPFEEQREEDKLLLIYRYKK